MRSDRKKAEEMRRAGKSYRHISRALGVSRSTLSRWFKDEIWSTVVREALIEKSSFASPRGAALASAKKEAAKARRASWRANADTLFRAHARSPLFMIGAGIYWAHGDKSPNTRAARITSTDPGVLRTFIRFMSECLRVPEQSIIAIPLVYPGTAALAQRRMWATHTGIPLERVREGVLVRGNIAAQRRSLGACTVVIYGAEWKEKVLRILERLVQEPAPL